MTAYSPNRHSPTLQAFVPNTRSPPAHAGGDQSHRAQEDSNLRPLDPQSNALSRLSYGHPTVPRCTYSARPPAPRQYTNTRSPLTGSCTERGGFEPPVPLRIQRLSRAPDSATLAPLPFQHLPRTDGPSLDKNGHRGPLASDGEGQGMRDRRGRDSNPRNRKRLNGFQDRLLRPLGHLSQAHGSGQHAEIRTATFTLYWQRHYTHAPEVCQQNRGMQAECRALRG
jgi:hypothetical protein